MSLNLSKEESLNMLNLRKESLNLLCLDKKPLNGLTSRVGVILDYSGSMYNLYNNGTVQSVLEKLFPLALQFDDNGEMELWIFSDGFYRLENIDINNYYGYVKNNIMKYRQGGTNYAPVLKDVYSKYMLEEPTNLPNYIIFITDGDNEDKQSATEVIKKMSKYPIFIQFVGIGNDSFEFLEKLDNMSGRYVDNASFFKIKDINKENDDDLYNKLLKEYPAWLEYQKVKEMISNATTRDDIFGGESKSFFQRMFSR